MIIFSIFFLLSIYGLCFRFQNYRDSVFVVEMVGTVLAFLQFITIIESTSLLFGCIHRELQPTS